MAIRKINVNGKDTFEVYINLRSPKGRFQKRLRGFTSMRAASEAEFKLKAEILDQQNRPKVWLWQEWMEYYLEREKLQLRLSTIQNYAGQMTKWATPVLNNMPLEMIRAEHIHEILFVQMSVRSPHSKLTMLKTIKRVLALAIEEGVLQRNPCNGFKIRIPEAKQSVLNAQEVDLLLREGAMNNHRFYPVWAMAVFTGMRSGELYALKWSDVFLEEEKIYVTKSWSSKTGIGPTKSRRNRVVPISTSLKLLLSQLRLKSNGEDFVLPRIVDWDNGEQAKILRDFCKVIGITQVKFHDLRATFITQMLLKGVPLAQVMAIVGHAELKTTDRYVRVAGSDLRGATDKLQFSLPREELARVIEIRPSV
ncbi:MAG: tyrosine-type recombinase/integrase [Bdellovibrionota bacterium]